MFLPKTVEDDWFLFLLGLVQVLVGGGDQPERQGRDRAVLPGRCWRSGCSACSRSTARRSGWPRRPMAVRRAGVDAGRSPIRGLLDLPFLLSAAAGRGDDAGPGRPDLPGDAPAADRWARSQSSGDGRQAPDRLRRRGPARPARRDPRERQRVMSVELFDRDGTGWSPTADAEYRWRGVTMDRYEKGRWRRPGSGSTATPSGSTERWRESPDHPPADQAGADRQPDPVRPPADPRRRRLRQRFDARAERGRRHALPARHPGRSRSTTRSISAADPSSPQPGESYPVDRVPRDRCSRCPTDLKARLRPIALAQRRGHPRRATSGARAAALERYLRESGEFRYTLQMDVGRPGPRPGRGLPGQPQGGPLRVLRQRPDAAAPLDRHPGPDGQRLQGGRLERPGRGHDRPPEARP